MSFWEGSKRRVLKTREEAAQWAAHHRLHGKKVVFTNGCFDLLHLGHVQYLNEAADLGNVLLVGLNTDRSVSALKGPERPLQSEQSRAHIMSSLRCVDAVVLFDEDTPLELIKAVKPDYLVKGGDYQIENIVGYSEVKSWAGQVVTIPFLEGFSTTSIVEKARK